MPSNDDIKNFFLVKAYNEAETQAQKNQLLAYYTGQQAEEEARSDITTNLLTLGIDPIGAVTGAARGAADLAAAEQAQLVAQGEFAAASTLAGEATSVADEQALVSQAAEQEKEEQKKKKGFRSTIATSGQGVLGQAPVQRAQLLGGGAVG